MTTRDGGVLDAGKTGGFGAGNIGGSNAGGIPTLGSTGGGKGSMPLAAMATLCGSIGVCAGTGGTESGAGDSGAVATPG